MIIVLNAEDLDIVRQFTSERGLKPIMRVLGYPSLYEMTSLEYVVRIESGKAEFIGAVDLESDEPQWVEIPDG